MKNQPTTEQASSNRDRIDDEIIRDPKHIVWFERGERGLLPPEDNPVYVGEVYELVSVMLRDAPLDHGPYDPTDRCLVETTNHRAWLPFADLVLRIHEEADLHHEARWSCSRCGLKAEDDRSCQPHRREADSGVLPDPTVLP